MRNFIHLSAALVFTLIMLATSCSTGDTNDHADGLHGTTRGAPATDLSDTGNYRLRNKRADESRGDTLPKNVSDTAFHTEPRL